MYEFIGYRVITQYKIIIVLALMEPEQLIIKYPNEFPNFDYTQFNNEKPINIIDYREIKQFPDIINSFTKYINSFQQFESMKSTIQGNYFVSSTFIETQTTDKYEYKQLVNVDYKNKHYNFIIGILILKSNSIEEIIIGEQSVRLNVGDIVWFPASWCYPFKEQYSIGTKSIKIMMDVFL